MKSTCMKKFLFPKKKKNCREKKKEKEKKSSVVWLLAWELNRSCLQWLSKDTLLSFGSNAASQAEGKWGYTYCEPAKLL